MVPQMVRHKAGELPTFDPWADFRGEEAMAGSGMPEEPDMARMIAAAQMRQGMVPGGPNPAAAATPERDVALTALRRRGLTPRQAALLLLGQGGLR